VPISVDGGDEIESSSPRVPTSRPVSSGAMAAPCRKWRSEPPRRSRRDSAKRQRPQTPPPAPAATTRHEATRASLLGAHVILEADDAAFVSLPSPGRPSLQLLRRVRTADVAGARRGGGIRPTRLFISPIILYDYPAIGPRRVPARSLTPLRSMRSSRCGFMTLTDEEKAEARATDAAAALIIDRCDAMTPEELQQLHGVLRDPLRMARGVEGADDLLGFGTPARVDRLRPLVRAGSWAVDDGVPSFVTPPDLDDESLGARNAPWWDPGVDGAVSPSN